MHGCHEEHACSATSCASYKKEMRSSIVEWACSVLCMSPCRVIRTDTEDVAAQVKTAVDEALEWLDDNQDAEEDEYKEKLKEVEDVCNPVVSSAYGKGGAGEDDDEDLGDHDEL